MPTRRPAANRRPSSATAGHRQGGQAALCLIFVSGPGLRSDNTKGGDVDVRAIRRQRPSTWACAAFMSGLLVSVGAAAATPAQFLNEGDRLYAARAQAGQAEKAIAAYQQALGLDPANAEAYWRVARAYYWLGTHAPNADAAAKLFEEGIEYGKLAVDAHAKSAAAHFWLGVSYGKYGEARGIMQSLHLVPHLQKAMETSLKLQPNLEDGGADRVLCRLYMKLPAFKGGSIEKSLAHCQKAVAAHPQCSMNHLFLAETLTQAGRKDEARRALQAVLDTPLQKGREPEQREEQVQARALLKGLE